MKTNDFALLTARQQHAMMIAVLVRIALEEFHAAHLSDGHMKQLNQLIRYGIYDGLSRIEAAQHESDGAAVYEWLIASIPDYWEIPGNDPHPTRSQSA